MADKALLLGINDYLNVNHLRGCLRDVENMGGLLVDVFGFAAGNVKTLTDRRVVKAEVKKQMAWLFKDVEAGDRVVLHFSGHGSYTADLDGDEDDGRDELVCLYDMDFDEPDSYLLDDELRAWAETKPEGVRLTIVLDNCNSGTGTRMVIPSPSGKGARAAEIDPKTAVMRSMARPSAARGVIGGAAGLQPSAVVAAVDDPEGDDFVRVRFVEPPAHIKEKVEEARSRKKRARGLVKVKELNHVLLSACRADETAADATIDGAPSGAFTYYLCQTLRDGGAELDRRDVIDRVTAALRAGSFPQDPQLEGADETGPLFGPSAGPGKATVDAAASSDQIAGAGVGSVEPYVRLAASMAGLAPDVQRRILDLYQQGLSAGLPPRRMTGLVGRAAANRAIVYVHGICKHVAGFSDDWWSALHPFTTEFGAGERGAGGTRDEVVWSDLVNARALSPAPGVEADDRARLAAQIRETLQDRMDRHAIESGPRSAPGEAPRALADSRALISIPWLNCVDDFTVYMTNDSVRASILSRFTTVVGPLLGQGVEIDVISHSWGTVVAYEGLRELAGGGAVAPLVRNFFTVGAALSIGAVKLRLRPENRDGARPAMVRRWVNLDALGDPVGGPLQGRPYAVDDDFPNLAPFSCSSFLGIVNPTCAHSSYFQQGNDAVNRDIFAKYINMA